MKIIQTVKIEENWTIIDYPRWLSRFIPVPCSYYRDKETFKLVWKFNGKYYHRKGFKMVNAPQR